MEWETNPELWEDLKKDRLAETIKAWQGRKLEREQIAQEEREKTGKDIDAGNLGTISKAELIRSYLDRLGFS